MTQPRFQPLNGSPSGLQLPPPFDFQGVTMKVFPVRASMLQLRHFCDAYLNIVPPEVGEFRPAAPYVFIQVLDYGRMSIAAANMGWISQHELTFGLILEWHRKVGGTMVFQDLAYLSPFIYVDNDFSMITGRRVYGWTKSLARFERDMSSWIARPSGPESVFTLSTKVFPRAYAGARREQRVLLEVVRKPGIVEPQLPPRTEDWLAMMTSLPRAMAGGMELMRDYAQIFNASSLWRGQQAPEVADVAARMLGGMNPFALELPFNTINLKQFRDSEMPDAACYQALVNAPMVTTGFNAGGMLGMGNVLLGDFSGGYRLHLHRYDSQPIIETLGLQVAEEWTVNDLTVSSLAPVFPYWADVDMRYNRGTTLAWRTRDSDWHLPSEAERLAQRGPAAARQSRGPNRYNTTLGDATEQLTGPFEFPNTTVRVLPLLARQDRLEAFCAAHIDIDDLIGRPYGSYVYLLITNVEEAISKSGSIGGWGFRQVAFAVPIKIENAATGELVKVAMLMPYVFINNSMAANTFSEVFGLESEPATITSPPNSWLDESGPADATTRHVLDVVARVFPALDVGQEAVERSVVEAFYGDILPYNDDVRWRFVAESWGRTLVDEYQTKVATANGHPEELESGLALALELLANKVPLSILTVKQFRSADEPNDACYQSIVEIPQTIQEIYDLREIESLMHVKVRNYPSLPIVETLGLIPKWVSTENYEEVYNLQPVRPFWMKLSMSQGLGLKLAERAGTTEWHKIRQPDTYFVRDAPSLVGRDLITRIALRTDLTYYWNESHDAEPRENEQKGLLAETMKVLGRLVELLTQGQGGDAIALGMEIADAVAEIGEVSQDGADELAEKLSMLAASLQQRGTDKLRAMGDEIARLVPRLRGAEGDDIATLLVLLKDLMASIRVETEERMAATRADMESILQRITRSYQANQKSLEQFRRMLDNESDPDARRVAGMLDATLERITRLLEHSARALGPADVGSIARYREEWAAIDEILHELVRDETSSAIRMLARKLYQPPRRLRTTVNDWQDELRRVGGQSLTRADGQRAVAKIPPQLIIESVLSREWEHWGAPRWCRNLEQKPDFSVLRQSIGFEGLRDKWFPKARCFDEDWFGTHDDVQIDRGTDMGSLAAMSFALQDEED